MATWDQGGGCPCGVMKVCDCKHADTNNRNQLENLAVNPMPPKDSNVVELAKSVLKDNGYIVLSRYECQTFGNIFTEFLEKISVIKEDLKKFGWQKK